MLGQMRFGESFKRGGENNIVCWGRESVELWFIWNDDSDANFYGGKGSCKKGSLNLTLHHSSLSPLLTHHNRQFPPLSLSKHCQELKHTKCLKISSTAVCSLSGCTLHPPVFTLAHHWQISSVIIASGMRHKTRSSLHASPRSLLAQFRSFVPCEHWADAGG